MKIVDLVKDLYNILKTDQDAVIYVANDEELNYMAYTFKVASIGKEKYVIYPLNDAEVVAKASLEDIESLISDKSNLTDKEIISLKNELQRLTHNINEKYYNEEEENAQRKLYKKVSDFVVDLNAILKIDPDAIIYAANDEELNYMSDQFEVASLGKGKYVIYPFTEEGEYEEEDY